MELSWNLLPACKKGGFHVKLLVTMVSIISCGILSESIYTPERHLHFSRLSYTADKIVFLYWLVSSIACHQA